MEETPMPGIDLHTHLAPTLTGARLPGVHEDTGTLVLDGNRVGLPDLYRPDRLEQHLTSVGLDEAVVTVPPPFYRQHLPADAAASWVSALNDGLVRAIAGHPRLTPLAYLPLEHAEVALAEYDRVADDPRWAGVAGAAGGRSIPLDDPRLAPLWLRLADDGRTVHLHPGQSADARLTRYYLANLLGNPMETTVAAAQLVFGQVLADYPGIRFLLAHCGGYLAAAVGRWERGHRTARPGLPDMALAPAAAARRFYVDVLGHDPALVDLAISVFGADRLVLGSDWPFPMGTDDPAALVRHRGTVYAAQVATTNAAAALGRRH
ncbi:amidohydrolase family protein [Plantactinospora sp. GCM10030261]|uniref:amidohydrolase family protein n=1 Tax=Plantactinospora sp. GCM10030261 TaxID=3273420 RepID=UPI003606E228